MARPLSQEEMDAREGERRLREVPIGELVSLCAVDSELFSRVFFPGTTRQASPPIAQEMWRLLEDPRARYLAIEAARGFAKTTRLRLFAMKRIAFAISHTILYVGPSESHASRSIQWIRGQIERNSLLSSTFGLEPGKKWQESEIELFHRVDRRPIWILGVGITGNIRGINFDDYRPDLIILDDIVTDENASSEDQRAKINDLVMGSLANSLTPASEEPNAKIVMLQTPQHVDDVSQQVKKSPMWTCATFPCWTRETVDLADSEKKSAWEERYPTPTLLAEKASYVAMNQGSVFAREMECRLVAKESCAFRKEWLQFYETRPKGAFCVIGVDPVPPPSERQLEKGLVGKDSEVVSAVARYGGKYYLLDYEMSKGHSPNWTIATIFEMALKYRASQIVVEAVAYQRVLEFLLKQEMVRRQQFWAVVPYVDTRKKYNRIVSTFSGVCSQLLFHVKPEMTDFISMFESYPNVKHDDLLDSVAIAMSKLTSPALEIGEGEYWEVDDFDVPQLEYRKGCP